MQHIGPCFCHNGFQSLVNDPDGPELFDQRQPGQKGISVSGSEKLHAKNFFLSIPVRPLPWPRHGQNLPAPVLLLLQNGQTAR